MKEGFSAGRGRVDGIGDALESRTSPLKLGHDIDQVGQATPWSVKPPKPPGIAFPNMGKGFGQPAFVRDRLGKDAFNRPHGVLPRHRGSSSPFFSYPGYSIEVSAQCT
jgi:hypothetical protein